MAASLTLVGDTLCIDISGWAKLLALSGGIRIPLAHVVRIRLAGADARDWLSGFKLKGARIPGLIKAGTFRADQTTVFWYVRHPEQAVLIELRDEKFAKLIIEVNEPETLVAQITRALGS